MDPQAWARMSGDAITLSQLEDTIARISAVLVEVKCIRWTYGTCSAHRDPEDEWCLVCRELSGLGYVPVFSSVTGDETWEKA